MANQRLFTKANRITTVVEDKVYQDLQRRADRQGLTISRYVSKVLTKLATGSDRPKKKKTQ